MTTGATMRHVPTETLLEHASGQLDLAFRVIVEAHLELCPSCRVELAGLAAPGGWLLQNAVDPTPPPGALWERLVARLPNEALGDPVPPEVPLPLAARRELPPGGALRWWSLLLGGARMATLAYDPATDVRLLLGEMPGGLAFPRHRHLGFEHVVVLSGGYGDERGELLAGDFGVYEPGSEHGPQTLDGDACWILFRLGGPVRFRGWRGAVLRLLI